MNSQNRYNTRQNFLGDKIELLLNDQYVGQVGTKNIFTGEMLGVLRDNRYVFKPKGFLGNEVYILDNEGKTIGLINDSWLSSGSTIDLHGKKYFWKINGFINLKWTIKDSAGLEIAYRSKLVTSNEEVDEKTECLFLVGLYLYTRYLSKLATFTVFTVLFINIGKMFG